MQFIQRYKLNYKLMENLRLRLLVVFTRIIGLVSFIFTMLIMLTPFFIIMLLYGLNKANVVMTTMMRHPMNMLLGDNTGDDLLEIYKDIYDGEL